MDKEKVSIFPIGEKNDAYAKYFVGQSYLNMLSTDKLLVGNVTFEPKCRNNWHVHHKGGQLLLCTAVVAIIKRGESQRENYIREML